MHYQADEQEGALVVVSAPEKLNGEHLIDAFDCGHNSLNEYLKKKALRNISDKNAVTYVVCERDTGQVVAYYSLCTGSVDRNEAPKKIARHTPPSIPVVLMGRLAVDKTYQGKGFGAGLLQDAVYRALSASESIGVRALLVHALDEEAKAFYTQHGFSESPVTPLTMMLSLK